MRDIKSHCFPRQHWKVAFDVIVFITFGVMLTIAKATKMKTVVVIHLFYSFTLFPFLQIFLSTFYCRLLNEKDLPSLFPFLTLHQHKRAFNSTQVSLQSFHPKVVSTLQLSITWRLVFRPLNKPHGNFSFCSCYLKQKLAVILIVMRKRLMWSSCILWPPLHSAICLCQLLLSPPTLHILLKSTAMRDRNWRP